MTNTTNVEVKARSKAKSPPRKEPGQHIEGSRKGKVHALFDKQGAEAAWTLGLKLKLKQSTLRSWFGTWHRAAHATKPPAKVSATKKPANEPVKAAEAAA